MQSSDQNPQLRADMLSLGYADRLVVDQLSLAILPGQITAIIGANACGKSTLLRGLARLLKPRTGTVYLNGDDIARLPSKIVATRVGILAQTLVAPDGLTVAELVALGRYPYQRWFRQWSSDDEASVIAALEATGMLDLADRLVDQLSGGQRQRAWIAMALAQETQFLLLDEPTTFLDIAHQIEVLNLLTELNRSKGATIVLVLHDLNLACRYAHHLVAMAQGRIIAEGAPTDVITPPLVKQVFDLDCCIIADPVTGTPLVIPTGIQAHPSRIPQSTPGGSTNEIPS